MIKVYHWNNEEKQFHEMAWQEYIASADKNEFYWIDFCEHDAAEESKILTEVFQLNPLAITDAQRKRHPPKYEKFSQYDFLMLKVFADELGPLEFETRQLAMFFSDTWLITRHASPMNVITNLLKRLLSKKKREVLHPINLALRIAKACTEIYTRHMLSLESRLEDLEEEMFQHPNDSLLTELVANKTYLRQVRRVFSYHKSVFKLMRVEYEHSKIKNLNHQVHDVFENFERLFSLTSLYYDTASDLIEGYISIASHRLNNIMKILTIITAIFVPLSFLAGVYGMNFSNMPELKSQYGYYVLIGLMVFIATVLLIVFRVRKWI